MAETINVANGGSTMKADTSQGVPDSHENGVGCNGTTNGSVTKGPETSKTDTATENKYHTHAKKNLSKWGNFKWR